MWIDLPGPGHRLATSHRFLMSDRYHYLDAARGILMILGIAYHAARVYGDGSWVISDSVTSPIFTRLALALTSFRMPAFFVMSGFFAARTLGQYGPRVFLERRMPRVVIPFVTALFTLNIAQLYALNRLHGGQPSGLDYLVSPSLWADFSSDRWISHLWFLVSLAYYFVAVALGAALLRARGQSQAFTRGVGRVTAFVGQPAAWLMLLAVANVAVLALFALFPSLYTWRPIVSTDDIVRHIPYFAAGLLIFANRPFYESMTRFNWGVLALTGGVLLFLIANPMPGRAIAARVVGAYARFLWTWAAIYWVLVIFRAMLDRPSQVTSTLADSAYSIYLFHHLTVILIAWWLLDVDLSIFVKYAVVVVSAFAVTLGLHLFVIRKTPLLTFLFNGKPAVRTTESSRRAS